MTLSTLRTKWLAPLVFFQVYLSATVILFFFGPWPWEVPKPLLLAVYLTAAQILIAVGYLLSWRRIRRLHSSGVSPARNILAGTDDSALVYQFGRDEWKTLKITAVGTPAAMGVTSRSCLTLAETPLFCAVRETKLIPL